MDEILNLSLYLKLFSGREDYFAQQGDNWYFPIPNAFNKYYLNRHLDGDTTFGIYVLNGESCCNLVCIDIDIPKNDFGDVDLSQPSAKYGYLKDKLTSVLETLSGPLTVPPESILLEETGGRGYHIWIFFSGPVQGQTAVKFGKVLQTYLDFEIEFFPKQGRLTQNRKYGNLIKLPLGLHRKYNSGSSFFYLQPQGPQFITGRLENLAHLRTIVPLDPKLVHDTLEDFVEELPLNEEALTPISRPDQTRPQFEGNPATLFLHCHAMGELLAKADQGIRFSNSEAFHFADVMLSIPGGEDNIHNTMRLSLKDAYDRIRTQDEIERIKPLYQPSCLTLVRKGICSKYCKESVRKRNEDPLTLGTTPCSVWLRKMPSKPISNSENLLERIGTTENLRRTFFQLRQYHEYEDALFFDPFDFEHFESRLDANCEILAKAFLERMQFTFTGYIPVPLPKKINEAQELEYRPMSYSTVYDQAPIQSIFNIIAPIVESEFQTKSYGYRWNSDPHSPNRIFEDWRKAYPRFRNDIMTGLKRHPNGFHVCCDIKGFYDNVDHSIQTEQLRKFILDAYVYQMIENTIRVYKSEKRKGYGLPQGPAYARLLANLYLNEFDIRISQVAAEYYRYVDDFVIIFESKEKAEEGLEHVILHLKELGLELSDDEFKRAIIESNTDISRVRKTLDKVHYGILEGTRHVQHLAPDAVADFMEAVKRYRASPVSLEELIKINDVLPSLLYVLDQDSIFPHPLKQKILNIVEFLIQHRWFCPKKLKSIFYRLLDLENDENRLHELFLAMEPVHKAYFLLSVFGCWQSRHERRELLERLVRDSLIDDCPFVYGFAVVIAAKLNIDIYSD